MKVTEGPVESETFLKPSQAHSNVDQTIEQQSLSGNQEPVPAPIDNQNQSEFLGQEQLMFPGPAGLHSQSTGGVVSNSGPDDQKLTGQKCLPQNQRSQIKEELESDYPSAGKSLGHLAIERRLQELEEQHQDLDVLELEDILGPLIPMDENRELTDEPRQQQQLQTHSVDQNSLGLATESAEDGHEQHDEFLKNLMEETLMEGQKTAVAVNKVCEGLASNRKRPLGSNDGSEESKKLPPSTKLVSSGQMTSSAVPLGNLTNKVQPPRIVSLNGNSSQTMRNNSVPHQLAPRQQSIIYQLIDDTSTSRSSASANDPSSSKNFYRLVYQDQSTKERLKVVQSNAGLRESNPRPETLPSQVDFQDRVQAPPYGQHSMRHRAIISTEHRLILEAALQKSSFPDRSMRVKLGRLTNLHPRQVQIWFQNQRSKAKKMGQHLN